MSEQTELILKQALALSPQNRATLIEGLLASLDQPDPKIDAVWAKVAEDRISAYESGQLETISAEAVLKKYQKS